MEARVAVLEQIAKETRETLMRLERHMDESFSRFDAKIEAVRDKQERDFRLLFGALITTALGLAA